MYSNINIQNSNISVLLHKNRIGIVNNDQLAALVSGIGNNTTEELVSAIKKEYSRLFNKEFNVSDDSIVVEIWGHIYADKFADAVKSISPIKLVDELADKISARCEMINIGEKGYDSNRFVWDLLAPLKSAIAAIL